MSCYSTSSLPGQERRPPQAPVHVLQREAPDEDQVCVQNQSQAPSKRLCRVQLCIGAATTAVAAGLEDSLIQILGQWKSLAYLAYIRIGPRRLAGVANSTFAL